HWLPGILGVYAVAAVLWLVAVLRGPVPRWADWASTAVDLLVIIMLCLVSGGATAALLPQSRRPRCVSCWRGDRCGCRRCKTCGGNWFRRPCSPTSDTTG